MDVRRVALQLEFVRPQAPCALPGQRVLVDPKAETTRERLS